MKRIRTLSHAISYSQSSTLFGTPEEADECLRDIEDLVAARGDQFPIVKLPDIRLATLPNNNSPGVFFRLSGVDRAELLWVLCYTMTAVRVAA
jgi:hypothetical protein